MSDEIEFDWDEENIGHLQRHRVLPVEFEQLIFNQPLDFEYQNEGGEDRFKSLGHTDGGRVLVAVWTLRNEKVRAVTAYPAGKSYSKLYGEMKK